MDRPLANSYWVLPGRLLAGEHPVGREREPGEAGQARLQQLLAAGISCFVDLTEEGECAPYASLLPATVSYLRHAIRDQRVPRRAAQMRRIQDEIASALSAGRTIYLHCRAGIGRTGMVAGCFLVEQGRDGDSALRELNVLWSEQSARAELWPEIPQTLDQAEYIRQWTPRSGASPAAAGAAAAAAAPARAEAALEFSDGELGPIRGLRERYQGAMLGLAVGDALAAATQFRRPGSFAPVGDLLGGGPFDLPRGAWSDDTAMALCLAESLAEREQFDAADQLERYLRWQREGYRSATGQCLGITASTARALTVALVQPRRAAGSHDPAQLDPEPLSRVAPVILHAYPEPEAAVALAAEAARSTCQSPLVLDACRLLGAMLHAALSGEPRERVLAPRAALFGKRALRSNVAAIAGRDFGAGYTPPAADGGVLSVLELACWCLASTRSFHEGALRAANLGGNSDVIGAVFGQLGGAYYGVGAIPRPWRQALAQVELIAELADRLLRNALVQIGDSAAAS
jgi:ADP-ribosyl-[dinitrogen reductase] hydrolase